MYTPQQSHIILNNLGFHWPDGSPVFESLTTSFNTGHTGLIGANGTGKSTLLKIIAGELQPTSGHIEVNAPVWYLKQTLNLENRADIASLLGIREPWDALQAILRGEGNEADYEVLGDRWELEAQTAEVLGRIGFGLTDLDRSVAELSGGEAMLVAVSGIFLHQPQIVLLDEPTNNLDARAREQLYRLIRDYTGTLVVVSHDTALLNLMDETAELYDGQLRVFGGNYTAYQEYLAVEQAAAQRELSAAEQQLRTEQRQRQETEQKLAKRKKVGQKAYDEKRVPKMIMNLRKREAQVSAAKLRGGQQAKVDEAREQVNQAEQRIRHDKTIRVELPDPEVGSGRRLAEFHIRPLVNMPEVDAQTPDTEARTITIQGPERVALIGPNGAGKTSLIQLLLQDLSGEHPDAHPAEYRTAAVAIQATALTNRLGYLPQNLTELFDERTVLEAVQDVAPEATAQQLRGRLAQFLFRGTAVERRVRDLSGGERFRVALAGLLLATPPAQLLILDEPTNNLDLDSVAQLVSALAEYRGALIVVSHDRRFLEQLGITASIRITDHGEIERFEELVELRFTNSGKFVTGVTHVD